MHMLTEIFPVALMITGFVFVMMVLIEYINVLTQGRWQKVLERWTWGQSLVTAALGSMPGCLGAFAVTSLYMHRVITVGAAVAAMIATCGDESFLMLALFPREALILFAALFVIGVVSGVLTDLVLKSKRTAPNKHLADYHVVHPEESACIPFSARALVEQWRKCSPHRGWLTVILVLFLVGVSTGELGHQHLSGLAHESAATGHVDEDEDVLVVETDHEHHVESTEAPAHEGHEEGGWTWVRVTLLVLGLVGLAIVVTVPDHFLDEHLWHHIVRVHLWQILLWTFGALSVTHLLSSWIDVQTLLGAHRVPVLVIACLVGIIPESGPHIVFVALFAEGSIPFSTLLASCIVQDGHGMIPMLAHSRRAFLLIKLINLVVGLVVGLLGLLLGI